ncbi:hypothetical protein DFP74_5525 [Nocardiopsis sp. Huas11]|uniref:hypothetical protein n=1 Tax=Nocardiopsis sp. Huas11 TaxID=2183912 RepID=UPI000EB50FED|nr:hypothetical protein [Nocardiopsis sp. Huas11]RKS09780.1 hypothetical protein DFP74_5525 [Nocardiopsis sp. Huas11]
MSRAESRSGRRGRRGGTRRAGQAYDRPDDLGPDTGTDGYDPEEDFSAEYGHTTDRAGEYQRDDTYDAGPGDEAHEDGPGDEPRRAGSRRASRRRRGRSDAGRGGVGKVSAFSASAIKKVSVLGDRPNQIVYTLAEQSKRKRGTAALGVLLGAFGIALVALLGLLVFQLTTTSDGVVEGGDQAVVIPPDGHGTLTPELYLSEENRDDVFGAIDQRPEGREPMTEEAVFGPVQEIELDGMSLELQDSSVTDSCTSMVWGEDLGQSLVDANCVNGATGVYTDSDGEYVAQVSLFDLANSDGATDVSAALDPTNPEHGAGFVLSQTGDVEGLEDGYSQANSQVMGHYLAVFWVARTDGSDPGDDSDMATLSVASMNAVRYVYDEVVEVGRAQE